MQACLLLRTYFGLGLRQTQGLVQSLLDLASSDLLAPDYTTLSRRCSCLAVMLGQQLSQQAAGFKKQGLVMAIDATGLSLYSASSWHRAKHRPGSGHCNDRWRKLHVAIDTQTGVILAAHYGPATDNDCLHLPTLLDRVTVPVCAVAADMAYDKRACRIAIHDRGARQLIPPQKNAALARDSAPALQERDDAILFFRHNTINGDPALARAAWKRHVGYHVRSRVETVFSQLKTHTGDRLTNRTEPNRCTQAMLKCVLLNRFAAL